MRCSILESPMLLCYCSQFWLSNYEKVFMQEKKAYRDKQGHLMTLRLDLTKCSLRVCCLHNAVCTKQMAKSTLRIIFTTCMDIQWLYCLMPLTTEVSDQTSPHQSHLSSRIVFCLFPHSVPTYKLRWVVSLAHVYV